MTAADTTATEPTGAPVARQLAMVFDLNKCLGCQTCTIACKKLWTGDPGQDYMYWNNVETAPTQGYPRGWQRLGGGRDGAGGKMRRGDIPSLADGYGHAWQFNHADVLLRDTADKQFLRPHDPDGRLPHWGPNWEEDRAAGEFPNSFYFYLPRLCNHCDTPACRDACPRGAVEKRARDGIVVVNQDKCHGYRFCVEACPYKKMYFDHQRQVADKCIFCFPRVEKGVAPACARACPGRLRFVGDRHKSTGTVALLVDKWKVALPLHPEHGTGPNVFYVPPLSPVTFDAHGKPTEHERIAPDVLVGLFGPTVGDALRTLRQERARVRAGGRSELMDLLIARDWHANFDLPDWPMG